MEGEVFSKGNLTNLCDPNEGWTESQYNQLKYQIMAYKYLIRNVSVPQEILDKIRSYENSEWENIREKNMSNIQETYEKRFENHDLVNFYLKLVYERIGCLL
jgi:acyl-homoserine lactone acylase PvdQ